MPPYKDDFAVARYVWNNYRSLFPVSLYRYAKYVVYGRKDEQGHRRDLGTDFDLFEKRYAGLDLDGIILAASSAVLKEQTSEIVIPRCPACNRVATTPIAEQCAYCPHEWRGQNPLRKAWESEQ